MINKNNYTSSEIHDILHIKNGSRKISFRYDLLNKSELKIGELTGATGRISYGENRAIMRSAVFELPESQYRHINFMSDIIKPWFILHMPGGGMVEWPLGVFLLESPSRIIKGASKTCVAGAYDKTIILEEDRFTERFYVSKGSGYVSTIERILATSGIVFSQIAANELTFAEETEYPTGTKKKDVINSLLRAINYTPIYADETGILKAFAYTAPGDRPVSHSYSSNTDSIILPDFEESSSMASRPNVFTRVALNADRAELSATFVNNDPASPYSTIRRGRKIVDFERINLISTQSVLNTFTKRVAIEKTTAYNSMSFSTILMPGHGCFQTIYLDIPEVMEQPAKFVETAWDMDLRFNGVMRHQVRRIIYL